MVLSDGIFALEIRKQGQDSDETAGYDLGITEASLSVMSCIVILLNSGRLIKNHGSCRRGPEDRETLKITVAASLFRPNFANVMMMT